MPRRSILWLSFFLLILASVSAFSQVQSNSQPSTERDSSSNALWVTATVGKEQVRFASLGIVGRMRLEILNQVGDRVYDSDFQDGSLLDWKLEGEEGRRLPDGLYGCFITVEDFSGQTSRRRGILWLKDGEARIEAMPGSGVKTAALAEESDSVTLLRPDVTLPITLLAHDGKGGRIISGKGGLSFHIGDFFSGNDVEHMRLTADGKLGLGVEEPDAKLDVAGMIRTSVGIMFPDGTIQRSAAGVGLVSAVRDGSGRDQTGSSNSVGSIARGSQSGNAANKGGFALVKSGPPGPIFATSGTAGRIAKFTNATDLGDSAIVESSGNIGIGTANPVNRFMVSDNNRGMEIAPNNGPTHATTFGSYDRAAPGYLPFDFAGSTIQFTAGGAPRMFVDSGGNVGIGTTSPGYALDVSTGATSYFRVQNTGDLNMGNILQRNEAAGSYNTTWVGYIPQSSTDLRFYNVSDRVTIQAGGNVGIGTISPRSKLTVAGDVNVTGTGNGIIFSDGSALKSNVAASTRAITYLAGCDSCSFLTTDDSQRTIYANLIGAMTINSVTCFSDAGSPIVNLQRDNGTAANILTSDLTCSTTGATSTDIAAAQNTMNLNDQIHFVMVTPGGAAKRITVIIKATVN